jgi:hypothetical protein
MEKELTNEPRLPTCLLCRHYRKASIDVSGMGVVRATPSLCAATDLVGDGSLRFTCDEARWNDALCGPTAKWQEILQ